MEARVIIRPDRALDGSITLELALRHPEWVKRLVLEDSAGLGRYVNQALRALTLPGHGDLAARMGRTSIGVAHRAWAWVPKMSARPQLATPAWVTDQRRLATLLHHLPTTLAALRAQVGPFGQRRVLLDALPGIQAPTLIAWGTQDKVLPVSQAHTAVARLRHGQIVIVPRCGPLPHLERPEHFLDALHAFDAT